MDPVTILIWTAVWAGVSAGIYATVYFANLTFQIVFNWFRQFAYLMVANDRRVPIKNRDHIAATIANKVEDGDFNIVAVDFNQKTGKVETAKVHKAGSIDDRIKQAHDHGKKEVAIWSF